MCNVSSQIKLTNSLLRSVLCDYSNAYILVKGTIRVPNTATTTASNNKKKNVIFKNCALFNDCISEIIKKETNNAQDIMS